MAPIRLYKSKNGVNNMSKWIWRLADNGWADWICPKCGWRYNDDIHVTLNYKYCPMCGERLIDDSEKV